MVDDPKHKIQFRVSSLISAEIKVEGALQGMEFMWDRQ